MSAILDCLDGESIHRRSYFRKSFFAFLLILTGIGLNVPTTSAQQPGFLSIDCGSTQENYIDSAGLQWVTDSGQYMNLGGTIEQPSVNEIHASRSFRYFAEGRSKYCYELPTPNVSIAQLVRASFYMDRSLRNTTQFSGVQFTLSLDATDWFTVSNIVGEDQGSLSVVEEAIFYPPNQITNVCLQPLTVGSPFISSLELRVLNDSSSYFYDGSNKQYLALAFRYNLGAQSTDPNVRYPDDIFDRIWTTPDASWNHLCPTVSVPEAPDNSISLGSNYVPPKVMKDAWLFQSTGGCTSANVPVYVNGPVYLTPADYFHVSIYFEYLNISDPSHYTEFVFVDENDSDVVYIGDFSNTANLHLFKYQTLSQNFLYLRPVMAANTPVLNDGPTINALELHGQYNYNFSTANSDDVVVITALKTGFSLTDWQGDPCTPVPHDWLSCNLSQPNFGNLQQPCRNDTSSSDSQCSAPQADLRTKYYVTSINLSHRTISGFSGVIGNTSAFPTGHSLDSLNYMSVTNSGVDNATFLYLISSASSELNTLDLSYNAIDHIPPASDWAGLANLTSLSLSHNNLTGELSAFEDVPFVNTLRTLDLSHNAMTSFPAAWTNTSTSLVSLDLSYNRFQEDISSLDEWLQMNYESLTEFHISNNEVGGPFPSDLYFQNLPKLRVANFDQNSIEGILNLSVWFAALLAANNAYSKNLSTPSHNVTLQLFSLIGNNISDIIPSAESFDSTIRSLINYTSGHFYNGGVLLSGNPYCNSPSSDIHVYFCRNSTNIHLKDPKKANNERLIVIIGISGGLFGLLFFTFMSTCLCKLRREVYALRDVQRELANRKVQPPLYRLSDLKLATLNFRKENKLGRGAFGIVYKGVLGDETPIAAKKLFNNQRLKVLDEFLNEVVLITGIKHRNLVQLKGCCIEEKQRILVYEYAEKGNLAEALWGSRAHGSLSWEQRLKICVGVARGLSYLHEELQPSIIHRDIKPENILLDTNFSPKIADFGLARQAVDDSIAARSTQIAGTVGYFAPEYIMWGELSDKLDVYSYGVLILEIVSGRKCIDPSRSNEEKVLTSWVTTMKKQDSLFEVVQNELRENCVMEEVIRAIHIGLLCIQQLPERRPTMSQVVTMFLGSMDIRVVSHESDNTIYKHLNNLLATIDNGIEYPKLSAIEEDSSVFPLLDVESLSAVNNSSSGSGTSPIVEMCTFYGR